MACRSACFLAALAALLGACTLEPHYHRPPAPVPALQGGAAGGTAAADIGWREFFPDPQLQQLIALALTDNRDLRVAVLNVQSAQAQYRIQRADLFPTVNASAVEQAQGIPLSVLEAEFPSGAAAGGSAPPTGGITVRTYNVGVGFTNYELDLFGRIRSLSHAALQQYFSSGETRRSVQLTLVAEVATAYLTVLADQTLLDITRDTLKSQEASYALTQRLFSGGTTTELALRQAETTVDTARANLALYNRQLAQDRDSLQLLLGAPIPDGIDFSGGLDRPNTVAELEEGIPSDVLVRRPDILAAEHQLMAANAQIGAARAAFLPAISLTGSFGSESPELSGLFKSGSRAWTFSPQISLPIFAGGANVANLQATKLARATAVAQYEKAIQTAFREVADALVARGTLDEQLAAQQALVTASAAAYRLADMRYRGGVDSYLSSLVEQVQLYSAEQQLQTVRLLRLQNLVTLYKALGGGLREHTAAAQTTLEPSSSESLPTHSGSSTSN
ncbi:MAG TPA: efflux transporter outer membrane subunit [Solirubrobacteraceae bacterium]|jgi:multidrug efflux system outer membrane protein|nr:efflux transporter outer membrane subunit [Solirubrobacteraceae bacterium]